MDNADMPAMPQNFTRDSRGRLLVSMAHEGCGGLSKREYFAGLAMQGMVSNMECVQAGCPEGKRLGDYISEQSLLMADALLAELEKAK